MRAAEEGRDIAPVGARVHPDTAAHGPRDRTDELEPAELRGAGAVQAHGEGCTAAGNQPAAGGRRGGKFAVQPQSQAGKPSIRDEEVRAEPHGRRRQVFRIGPREQVDELVHTGGPGKPARGPSGSQGGEP